MGSVIYNLVGGGGVFSGGGSKKILLCKEGSLQNKNIWEMCFVNFT